MAEDYMKARGTGAREERSSGMSKREMSSLKDNKQDGDVFSISTETEKYDLGRVRYHSVGTKGYPKQAFEYDY